MSTAATRAPERIAGNAPPVGRRVAARRRVAVPLNVTVLRSGVPDAVPGRSVDVCEGGIGAVLAGELFPGELVGVEFHLPKSGQVLAKARVCYQDRLRCGLQFLAIPAEQKAMIESWANQGQESAVPVAPTPPQSSVPKASVPTARTSSPPRIERPRTERSATPAAPTFAGYSATPKRRPSSTPRYMRHKVVMLLVASVVAVVGMGWLRWEEGWRELESRLPGHTVEQPQATVPSEVMLHLLVHKVDPAVPDGIGSARARGRVVLDAVIGSDGTVLSLRPETGPDLLARVAMDAVQWWRFQPYQVNGQAVQVATKIAIDFP